MKIEPGSVPAGFLPALATEYSASGRYLCQDETLDHGTEEIAIGIAPVAGVPAEVDRVDAQLCCMFL